MTLDEAIARLEYHADGTQDGFDLPSFVGMLRPYSGLREEAYLDVMNCLRVLSEELRSQESLPRRLASALVAVTWYPRYWGLDPEGMLRRNDLISAAEQKRLKCWTDQIHCTFAFLLDGADDVVAFREP